MITIVVMNWRLVPEDTKVGICVYNYLSSEHPCGSSQPSLALYESGGEREARVLSFGSLLGKVRMGVKPLGEQVVAAAHVAEEPCFQGG